MTLPYQSILEATKILKKGGLVAYPTEAVYGLGCDPFNQRAVEHLLYIKQRSMAKGLILITHDWRFIENLIRPIDQNRLTQVLATWPGPSTWVFPATDKTPPWICGDYHSVAVRITNHPVARQLCQEFLNPVVSTSANLTNQEPLRNYQAVLDNFQNKVDYIIQGDVGGLTNPTPIRDAMSGKIIRI